MSTNIYVGTGNIGHDPELRYTKAQVPVLNMRLAVDRHHYKETDEGRERIDRTEWIPVTVWGPEAERQAKYLQKGSKITVVGELRERMAQTPDGASYSKLEVHATRIDWLDKIRSETPIIVEHQQTALF